MLTAEVVNSSLTGVSVDVAYVCTQPIVAVDVAAFVVVSVSAPEPPPPVISPVNVEAPVTESVPKSVVAPVACNVLDACSAPVNVEEALEINPASVETPVTFSVLPTEDEAVDWNPARLESPETPSVPPVSMFVEIVVAACVATIPKSRMPATTMPSVNQLALYAQFAKPFIYLKFIN